MNTSRAKPKPHAEKKNVRRVTAPSLTDNTFIAKPQLVAAIGHDLRQLLCALNLYNESLSLEVKDPYCLELTHHMEVAIAAMKGMLDSMLDVLRYGEANLSPKRSRFALAGVLNRLNAEFSPQACAKGLQWTCESNDTFVQTDPVLLETVLRNFICNALKYTTCGAVWVTCKPWTQHEVSIAVGDTGIGIPEDQQSLIFGEFYRVDAGLAARSEGLGLGLSIVACICKHLDYRVFVESTVDKGSIFTLVCDTRDVQPERKHTTRHASRR